MNRELGICRIGIAGNTCHCYARKSRNTHKCRSPRIPWCKFSYLMLAVKRPKREHDIERIVI